MPHDTLPAPASPWADDLLEYEKLGETFTRLIQTVDDSKVISIEAGFGHGKTFFREAWAKHLRQAGEVVIEVDAQRSDHSGDPVVTFLGALLAELPVEEKGKVQKAGALGRKYGGVVARSLTKAVLKAGADEVIDAVSGEIGEVFEGQEALQSMADSVGEEMSKTAAQMIATQLAAEKAIQKELPAQLDALKAELTKGKETDRVIILIDELDRCHPEYAIALLEAMKHVFDRPGYVFCLMVNADYLEKVAQHRFGAHGEGERYLDKFVDLRLALKATAEAKGRATYQLVLQQLDIGTPYSDDETFSIEAAAKLTASIVVNSDLSFRQIKRILDRVEIALRCYVEMPLDRSMLIYLAFCHSGTRFTFEESWLPQAILVPVSVRKTLLGSEEREEKNREELRQKNREKEERRKAGLEPLFGAERMFPPKHIVTPYQKQAKIFGPHYIPDHEAVLNAAHALMANPAD
ncbi:NTPase [Celeribacter sp. HF31]|uniref:KAP family P-loop NTPase fold protein n=1 Tax=Celeribacter sp. HF31 TaxID=2721558 RepID=UPI001430953B|nr:P-loop NTPase fold protein [Celeribacter sp. HF31]NIY80024.1 NTPase [Celeribacter sp. HF31]